MGIGDWGLDVRDWRFGDGDGLPPTVILSASEGSRYMSIV